MPLEALHLDRQALQPFTIYRVDPHRKILIEERSIHGFPVFCETVRRSVG